MKYYGWNYLPLREIGAIEFRRGALCTLVEVSDVSGGSPRIYPSGYLLHNTGRYPRTGGGLRMFLESSHLETVQIPKLFKHSSFNAWDEPIPIGTLEEDQAVLMRRVIAEVVCKSVLNTAWKLWGDDSPAISSDLDENQFRSVVYTFFVRKWPCFPVLHRPSFRGISPGSVSLQDGRTYVNLVIAATEKKYRDGQMHRTLFL